MANNSPAKSDDNKKFAFQTLEMLAPILNKKQFQLVNLEVGLKMGKLSKEQFSEQQSRIATEIENLQKRILRETIIVGS